MLWQPVNPLPLVPKTQRNPEFGATYQPHGGKELAVSKVSKPGFSNFLSQSHDDA
jgi:hypothetical protein